MIGGRSWWVVGLILILTAGPLMGCTGNEPDTSTPTPIHNHTDESTPATSEVIDCTSFKHKEIALKLSNGVVANITVEAGHQHTSITSFWLYDVRWSLKNEGDEEVKVDKIEVNLGEGDFNRSINTTLKPGETNTSNRNHLIYPPHRILLEKKVSPRIEGRIEFACEDQRLEKNFVIQPPIARFGDKLKIEDQHVTLTGWNRSNSILWSCEGKNYSYEADSGMDFITLSYEVRNEVEEELKPPSFSWIELATEKGEIYETWVPADLLQNEKEGLNGSALKCLTGTNNELMPGEVVKAFQVFEIPQNENPDFIKISSCLLEI